MMAPTRILATWGMLVLPLPAFAAPFCVRTQELPRLRREEGVEATEWSSWLIMETSEGEEGGWK